MNKTEVSQKKINPDKIAKQAAAVGVFGNIFLAVFKLVAGIVGHSAAMISDAIHTISDIFATIIAYVGVLISRKGADKEHPYGHERMECVASLLLAAILLGTGLALGYSCVMSIKTGDYLNAQPPTMVALLGAAVSIAVKEVMFWYTLYQAKRMDSSAFRADAWHHRSDALSSIGALIGIQGARMGFPIADQIAGIIICAVIIYVAIGIVKDAISKMLDTSCSDEFEKEVHSFISDFSEKINEKIGIDYLKTRTFGEKIYADVEINIDGNMSLKNAHDIADGLHNQLEREFPNVKHVMIHMNPAGYNYSVGD